MHSFTQLLADQPVISVDDTSNSLSNSEVFSEDFLLIPGCFNESYIAEKGKLPLNVEWYEKLSMTGFITALELKGFSAKFALLCIKVALGLTKLQSLCIKQMY